MFCSFCARFGRQRVIVNELLEGNRQAGFAWSTRNTPTRKCAENGSGLYLRRGREAGGRGQVLRRQFLRRHVRESVPNDPRSSSKAGRTPCVHMRARTLPLVLRPWATH